MNSDTFHTQVERLRTRWKNSFDKEFVSLLGSEVGQMSNEDFVSVVNFLIGSRPVSRPPLVQDFRDARLNQEKQKFNRDVNGAAQAMSKEWQGGLKTLLDKEYPGAKTLNEAVEIQVMKNQISRAK